MLASAAMSANHSRDAGPEGGDSLEASLVATIPPVMRHLLAHARRRPVWEEMTYQQYNVMRIIELEGPIPQGDIARRLLVSPPVVTRLAASLVEDALVERVGDPKDRRSVLLQLTVGGATRVRDMRHELLAAARELLEPLPRPRRDALARALGELQVLLPPVASRR